MAVLDVKHGNSCSLSCDADVDAQQRQKEAAACDACDRAAIAQNNVVGTKTEAEPVVTLFRRESS